MFRTISTSVSEPDESELSVKVRAGSQQSDTATLTVTRQSPSKKLGDKISSWFRTSMEHGEGRRQSGEKQTRRNSEGSKGSSSGLVSKFRKSFRDKRPSFGGGRQRTTSFGSLPSKENTPVGSLNVTGESHDTMTQYYYLSTFS